MPGMPGEPEAFAQQVAAMLRDIKPDCEVELTGPRELLVNGRRLDLENVYRMVSTEPDRGSEIVRHYLGQLFATEAESVSGMTLDFARPRIMPRIQPVSIFEHLDEQMDAHVPFVNDTVIVFVTDLPQMTVSITTEQLLKWGVFTEEDAEFALKNHDHSMLLKSDHFDPRLRLPSLLRAVQKSHRNLWCLEVYCEINYLGCVK